MSERRRFNVVHMKTIGQQAGDTGMRTMDGADMSVGRHDWSRALRWAEAAAVAALVALAGVLTMRGRP